MIQQFYFCLCVCVYVVIYVCINLYTHTYIYISKRHESRNWNRYLHTHVHSSIIFHNSQQVEATQLPSMDQQKNEMWYIYATDNYSGLKRNEILTLAVTWMNSEGIMLGEISNRRRTYTLGSTFMRYLDQSNSQRQKAEGGCQGQGVEYGELLLKV